MISLNVYKSGKVVKTVTARPENIMFGTIEDILAIVDVDVFDNNLDNVTFAKALASMVVKAFGKLRPMLLDVFPDMTEEDLRNVRVGDIVPVIMSIIKYTFAQMVPAAGGSGGKNA